jgi:hypothetical protein
MSDEGEGWTIWSADNTRGRNCGACKLCCTLVPVRAAELDKDGGVKCKHVFSKGCSIYAQRPAPCRSWSCRWLFDPMTEGLRRPDRSGYIIDPQLDTILAEGQPMEVAQIWVDPQRRDAHRDPALRAYLEAVADKFGLVSIIRWSSTDAMILVPPSRSSEREWLELTRPMLTEAEMKAKIAAAEAA